MESVKVRYSSDVLQEKDVPYGVSRGEILIWRMTRRGSPRFVGRNSSGVCIGDISVVGYWQLGSLIFLDFIKINMRKNVYYRRFIVWVS